PCRCTNNLIPVCPEVLKMSPTEIRVEPDYQWKIGLIAVVGLAAFYFIFGYLPLILLIAGAVLATTLLFRAIRGNSTDPCIIIDEQGVFDRRLKVGVIRWE